MERIRKYTPLGIKYVNDTDVMHSKGNIVNVVLYLCMEYNT